VDEGIVPPEFLPEDATPGAQLTDSGDQSKPAEPTPRAPYAGQAPPPPAPAAPTGNPAMKATKDDDWEEAVKWAEEASKEGD